MTREEAIETIKDICLTTEQLTRVENALGCLLSQPSLPSDLDEAAQKVEDYYDVGEEHGYLYCHRGDIKDAFKAGAEWMAGQGCTVEIDKGYFMNNPQHVGREGKFHKYYSSTFCHSKIISVTPGDKVVV